MSSKKERREKAWRMAKIIADKEAERIFAERGLSLNGKKQKTTLLKNTSSVAASGAAQFVKANVQSNMIDCSGRVGFVAEDVEARVARIFFKQVEKVGLNNLKNGADLVVNGVKIQVKYYRTAAQTMKACIDVKSGIFRYSGMEICVPRDQFEKCIALLREQIKAGKVPGIKSPAKAASMIKKGLISYKEAKILGSLKLTPAKAAIGLSAGIFIVEGGLRYRKVRKGEITQGQFLKDTLIDLVGTATGTLSGLAAISAGGVIAIPTSIAGNAVGRKAAKYILDQFIDDDNIRIKKFTDNLAQQEWERENLEQLRQTTIGLPPQ